MCGAASVGQVLELLGSGALLHVEVRSKGSLQINADGQQQRGMVL